MNRKLFFTILHTVALLALIVVIGMDTSWYVAALGAWICVSLYVFARMQTHVFTTLMARIKRQDEELKHAVKQFNEFVNSVNKQAEDFKQKMNVCRECEQHPGVVRPGSVHVGSAANCQVGQGMKQAIPAQELKSGDWKPCALCVTEGNKTTEFKQGNCPIHN